MMLAGIEGTHVLSNKKRVTELDVEESLWAVKKGERETGMQTDVQKNDVC